MALAYVSSRSSFSVNTEKTGVWQQRVFLVSTQDDLMAAHIKPTDCECQLQSSHGNRSQLPTGWEEHYIAESQW